MYVVLYVLSVYIFILLKCCLLNCVLFLSGCCVISEYGFVECVCNLLLIMCVSFNMYIIFIEIWLLNGLFVCLL